MDRDKFIWGVVLISLLLIIEHWRHPGPEPNETSSSLTAIQSEQSRDAQQIQQDAEQYDKHVETAKEATKVLNRVIYWTLHDILTFTIKALEAWKNIQNPFFRFLIFFGAVMGLFNVALALKRSLQARKMEIFCPYPECRASGKPVAGSWNRYRCKRGHQFNGESHGIY
jgi:hypothetical protein